MDNLAELEKYARKNNIPVLLDESAKFLTEFVKKYKYGSTYVVIFRKKEGERVED